MPKRALVEQRPWLLASIAAAIAYYVLADAPLPGIGLIALKGAGVGCLAAYAFIRHPGSDARLLALVMALGALGDMAMELGTTIGGAVFFFGHLAAIALYLRNRRESVTGSQKAAAVVMLLFVPAIAWLLVSRLDGAIGVAIYALVLGGMAGLAWTSRFPRYQVGLGAVLFVISDLLIFARMDLLAGSPVPHLLIWPTYYIGQFMIATGVIQTLRGESSDAEPLEA